MSVLSICKALPYSYNRDLQEVTPHLLKATKTTAASVAVMKGMVEKLELKREEMKRKAQIGFTTATELADTIVRETGVSFRTAHKIVSSMAEKGVDKVTLEELNEVAGAVIGKKLSELGLNDEKVNEAMNIVSNIEKRAVQGGPAKKEVLRMLRVRKMDLDKDEKSRQAKEERVKRSLEELEGEVE